MKNLLRVMAILFMLLLFVDGQAQDLKAPVHLRIGTMDLGSAHYVYGATFAKLWRNILPKGSTIDVLPFAGGIGNALILDKGDAELGFLFSATTNWALRGESSLFQKNRGHYRTGWRAG